MASCGGLLKGNGVMWRPGNSVRELGYKDMLYVVDVGGLEELIGLPLNGGELGCCADIITLKMLLSLPRHTDVKHCITVTGD